MKKGNATFKDSWMCENRIVAKNCFLSIVQKYIFLKAIKTEPNKTLKKKKIRI